MDIYLILVIVLFILGILLCIKSIMIKKAASKIYNEICEDKNISDEEFRRIRKEKVWGPKKRAKYINIFGFILLTLPNGVYAIFNGLYIPAAISFIATIVIVIKTCEDM